ncbi:MAG: YhdP family protein [Polynucleobacter sp.]|nr:YhdP family protein [Polynucleobacter sp.]
MLHKLTWNAFVSGIQKGIPRPKGPRWLKRLLIALGVLFFLSIALHFGVRYLVWPQIETSKPALEKLISGRLGVSVTMDDVRVSWDGLRPEFDIKGLRFYPSKQDGSQQNKPALEIQSIAGELSLLSFYHLAPYFYQLHISDVELSALRDRDGALSIGGILLDPDQTGYTGSNWLLSQNAIRIDRANIHWRDLEKKNLNTEMRLESASFLTSGLRSHLINVEAFLPGDPSPIKLSADFSHGMRGQVGDWRNWSGEFHWEFKGLNLDRLAQDFKLPLPILEGILESRGYFSLSSGSLNGGNALLFADDLRVQFKKEKDLLEFGRLEAELLESSKGKIVSVTSKKLAWRDFGSTDRTPLKQLSPMSFYWKPPKAGQEIREFGFASPNIDIQDATLFALNLPLPSKIHRILLDSKASGVLENVDIQWAENESTLPLPKSWLPDSNLDFSIKADLKNIRFLGPRNVMPSVINLSGRLDSNQKQGSLTLDSSNLEVDVSGFLADPKLKLDAAKGRLEWLRTKNQWQINGKDIALKNADVSATLTTAYAFGDPKQADRLILDMQFNRATLTQVHRYLPIEMDADTRTYLSKAFAGGEIRNGTLHIKGDPDQIPYSSKYPGEFTVNLPITNTTFSPAPTFPVSQGIWPAFTKVDGLVAMKGALLDVQIKQAQYKNVVLSGIQAQIADVTLDTLDLTLKGSAKGDLGELLDYITPSPILAKQKSIAESLKVAGPASLSVDMKLPLSGTKEAQIDLRLGLLGNQLQWSDLPPMNNIKGNVRIADDVPELENISAEFLGGDIKVSSEPAKGGAKLFNVSGKANAVALKTHFSSRIDSDFSPFLNAISGRFSYDGQVRMDKAATDTNLTFNLNPFGLSAPEPLNKVVNSPLTGRLNLKSTSDSKSGARNFIWSGQIGDQIFTQGNYLSGMPLRHAYGIGTPAILPQNGLALAITRNELDLDAWQAFLTLPKNPALKESSVKPPIPVRPVTDSSPVQMNAQIKKLTALNRIWPDMQLSASQKNALLQLRITSPFITGQVQWQEKQGADVAGLLSGKLATLRFPEMIKVDSQIQQGNSKKADPLRVSVDDLPNVNLTIEDFQFGTAQFGQVKMKASRSPGTLTIDALNVENPEDTANISGTWKSGSQGQNDHTALNVKMAVRDLGPIATRWGNPKAIEGGEGTISGQLAWDGSPFDPQLDTLSGNLKLALEKGRLLKVDTTSAKIFGVLSLQSLLRFATLDLQGSLGTIVTQGTAFKAITGDFTLRNGVARTTSFLMELDQARVAMSGLVNVPKETQDLRITIFPGIDATSGALAVFAINPIAGLGALIGQYLVTNQINKAMQSDYLVQGSWADPEIIPLNQQGQPLDPKVLDSIRTKGLLREQTKPSAPNSPKSTSRMTSPEATSSPN